MEDFDPNYIIIKGASQNNLRNISLKIPKNSLTVVTGVSGSGKSSLVFDTIYAESHRLYVQSLSNYVKHFLNVQEKPEVDSITGLSVGICIDQKTSSANTRSTVGTMSELYDYLRLLFARAGDVFSPSTNRIIRKYYPSEITDELMKLPFGTKIRILSPISRGINISLITDLKNLLLNGHRRIRVNGENFDIADFEPISGEKYDIDLIVDRIIVKEESSSRIFNSVESAMNFGDGVVIIDFVEISNINNIAVFFDYNITNETSVSLSNKFICLESGFSIESLEPRIFSFNSPFGACKQCHGIGLEKAFKEELIIPNEELSLFEGAVDPWRFNTDRYNNDIINAISEKFDFDSSIPYKNLPENVKNYILYGDKENNKLDIKIIDQNGRKKIESVVFEGVVNELIKKSALEDNNILDMLSNYQDHIPCKACNGYRIKADSLAVKILNKNIGEISKLSILDLKKWIEDLEKNLSEEKISIIKNIIKEISLRCGFLINVGLEYLSIDRPSLTLSGGESQRIRLASQIGSGLSGVIYVLDEPSIGLHQSDNRKLIESMKYLKSLGNTVIVVEHDEETMKEADYLIDIGPGAGIYGGEVISCGTPKEVMADERSITGCFLSGKDKIEVPEGRRKFGKNTFITLTNVKENNLKNLDVKIPLGLFIAITGVSGGGKSSLIIDTLYPALMQKIYNQKSKVGYFSKITGTEYINKVIKIDQSPIGRTPRSNPATYIGLFNFIRDIFVMMPESRARGYKAGRFSFNVKGGRCENCQGDGSIKVEMHFLPDVYIQCPVCKGKRYNKKTLEVLYKGKSISDILEMTPIEAVKIFKDVPIIKEKLDSLIKVGLDYIKLGQSSTTLSGGEAQRIKLSKELAKRATGDTMYILDEPTTGLHFGDIKKLLNILHTLVDYGNTIIVIEHNLDVIKTADYIIDIGPKGGKEGGYIVAEGTPEEVALNQNSVTGKFIKPLLPKLVDIL